MIIECSVGIIKNACKVDCLRTFMVGQPAGTKKQ